MTMQTARDNPNKYIALFVPPMEKQPAACTIYKMQPNETVQNRHEKYKISQKSSARHIKHKIKNQIKIVDISAATSFLPRRRMQMMIE